MTIFSQSDINKVCFDRNVAQKIAIDLVKGDSAKAELEKTQKLVSQLKKKIVEQDSTIMFYIRKDTNYITQLKTYADLKEKQFVINKSLEKDIEKFKTENETLRTSLKWVGGGFLGTLISLLTFAIAK